MSPVQMLDEPAFSALVQAHRHELRVHCYRMVGSFSDSEDLVQEALLRAWRKRDTFQGRSTARAWLYRITTNVCLDFLDSVQRRPRAEGAAGATAAGSAARSPDLTPWLEPYPDLLLDRAAPHDAEPDAAVIEKETIELAFLIAVQHLPPRQRAVLIVRDILGWPAADTADMLGLSVASVNSALPRARATLRSHLPPRRLEWAPAADPTEAERTLIQRYMALLERADTGAMAELLHEDIRVTMPMPQPCESSTRERLWAGREAFTAALAEILDPAAPGYLGHWRRLPTRANRQPAVAHYLRRPGDTLYRAQVLEVLWVAEGRIAEITSFAPDLLPAFGLPATC
ncbi:RNA polymerase subunit sigma-70 [Planobispora takensis]|uniref:RNA polymerase sigma factor n=1 Tax=Planobispora takensis TaxID=1367882 RepID=A0A8J3SWC7_9ACTN|nr:RNA polymerase subunit sigma-70 [Planobispora takensis]GII01438.1 RNA polymerase sigma factor [Planobispora takensis]